MSRTVAALVVAGLPGVLWAQAVESSVTRSSDGLQVITRKSGDTSVTERRAPSQNGGTVPLERVEERVISQNERGSVVERVVVRYDQDGRPGPPEKTRIEDRKNPDGSQTTTTAIYRTDFNGQTNLDQRTTSEVRKQGATTVDNTVIERRSADGRLAVSEKRESNIETRGGSSTESTVVYRPTFNGTMRETLRENVETKRENGTLVENKVEYEPGPTGAFQVTKQAVTRTEKRPDGSMVSVVDIYATGVPGRPADPSDKPQLREQQVIERVPGPGSTVREVVTVRRASPDDRGRLSGPSQVISESVCQGKCKP